MQKSIWVKKDIIISLHTFFKHIWFKGWNRRYISFIFHFIPKGDYVLILKLYWGLISIFKTILGLLVIYPYYYYYYYYFFSMIQLIQNSFGGNSSLCIKQNSRVGKGVITPHPGNWWSHSKQQESSTSTQSGIDVQILEGAEQESFLLLDCNPTI